MPRATLRVRLFAVTLGLAVLSCADFSLAPAPGSPAIQSFAPHAAFAGERLRVKAENLDAKAESNVVLFASGSARGERFVEGALQVTVPDGAGSGALVLENGHGRSAPQAGFAYRGLGHPRRGTLALAHRIGLRPVGLAEVGGSVFLASEWMKSLLGPDGRRLRLGFAPAGFDAIPGTTALVVGSGSDGRLYRADVAAWPASRLEPLAADTGLEETLFLQAGTDAVGRKVAWVLGLAGENVQLKIVDLAAEALLPGPTVDLAYFDEAQVSADGRWLVAPGGTGTLDDLKHSILVVDLASAGTPFWHVALPVGEALHRGTVAVSGATAYVPMVDGRIFQLRLGAGDPIWATAADGTYASFDVFYGLVVGGMRYLPEGGGTLVAQIPGEGRLVALDAATGTRRWSVPTSEEALGRFSYDAGAQRLHVADLRANEVVVVDCAAGQVVDRLSFALGLGSTSDAPGQGAVFDAKRKRVLVPARRPRVLVPLDPDSLEVGEPIFLDDKPTTSPPRAVQVSPQGTVWVLHEGHLGRIGLDEHGEEVETGLLALDGLGQRLAFLGDADDTVLVGMNDRVDLVRNGMLVKGLTFSGGFLELLVPTPDKLLVLWSKQVGQYDQPVGAVYSLPDLGPGEVLVLPDPAREFLGAVEVAGRPWLFYVPKEAREDAMPGEADALVDWGSTGFRVESGLGSSVRQIGPVAATPDGRRLVWTDVIADDGLLHFSEHVPAAEGGAKERFADTSVGALPGPLCGLAFSESGERAYVPVCSGDYVAVVE